MWPFQGGFFQLLYRESCTVALVVVSAQTLKHGNGFRSNAFPLEVRALAARCDGLDNLSSSR